MSSSLFSPSDFRSAFHPLPAISPDAPNWGERFAKELPSLAPPYYGVNLVDVRREHFDAVFRNIEAQVQGAEALFGGRLHLFSATDYGEVRRVIFVIYYETFPDSLAGVIPGVDSDSDEFPDIWNGSELWIEFTRLAEGYTWWVTPALTAEAMP